MRAWLFIPVLLITALALTSCTPSTNEPEWGGTGSWVVKQTLVPVGVPPASPDDERVRGVQPSIPEQYRRMNVDLATFGLRWNEAAELLDHPELSVAEMTTVYQKTMLAFGFRLGGQDWHTAAGAVDYETGAVVYADLEWAAWMTSRPDADARAIPDAWLCLVYAATDDITLDDARAIVEEVTAVVDGSQTLVRDGVSYRFTTANGEGNLVVTGAE